MRHKYKALKITQHGISFMGKSKELSAKLSFLRDMYGSDTQVKDLVEYLSVCKYHYTSIQAIQGFRMRDQKPKTKNQLS